MQSIMPCLWFDGRADEAAHFYVSVFKRGRILDTVWSGEKVLGSPGAVLTVSFEIDGREFLALNGGPLYKFTPAISFIANCDTQQELDDLWDKLCRDGQADRCGWLADKFGVSWQVVPSSLPEMLQSPDPKVTGRVMTAMLQMVKLDIKTLQDAYDGR